MYFILGVVVVVVVVVILLVVVLRSGGGGGRSSCSSMEARENGGFGRGSRFTEYFDGTCADICAPPHMELSRGMAI